jgi:hypothetical protein
MIQSGPLLENLFGISISALGGKDPLPKFAAAELWVSAEYI